VVRKGDPAGPPSAEPEPSLAAGPGRRVRRFTTADPGLPRRSPQANLAPQLRDDPPAHSTAAGGRQDGRSADQARALIASIRQGWRNGGTGTDRAESNHDANNDGAQA
jgi:hypothetical protein